MLLFLDTLQGIANALEYLQHHLHELIKRQNVSENNINTTLVALTTQLQQLTQLVANPPPSAHTKHTSPTCTIFSSVSALCSDSKTNMSQALLFSGLQQRTSQWPHIFELLLPLHPPGPRAVLWWTGENSLSPYILQRWSCCQVVQKRIPSGNRYWYFSYPNLGRLWTTWVHFFLVNMEADMINALEGTSYHQGGWMVDDYLDNFQALVSDAGYTDPWTLVVKFRWDLRLGIQNQIATMPYG